jgi:hypothetical protein
MNATQLNGKTKAVLECIAEMNCPPGEAADLLKG